MGCAPCVYAVQGESKKGQWISLELELHAVVSQHVGNQTWVL